MKRINGMNDVKLKKVKEKLASEKLGHISDILEYKFSLNNICKVNKSEYSILIEDNGSLFGHTYNINDLIDTNVNIEACVLRRKFYMSF